jgi:hypothetical protein
VDREHIAWLGIVTLLLGVGLLIGRRFLSPGDGVDVGLFRQWFWESRSLDLLVQVGLVFAGALGIAALLPRGREEEE